MARAERNSDGSYDAVDSGGFGKDYHGQDAFGERIGGTGIGGSHFGGKAAGDFSDEDELGEGHYTERYTNYGQVTPTESLTELGDATEVADSMREQIQGVNEETAENSNTGSMDTSFQIGGGLEDPEREELERAAREAYTTKVTAEQGKAILNERKENINNAINQMESKYTSGAENKVIDALEKLAQKFGYYDEFDRNKIEEAYKEKGIEGLRNVNEEISKTVEAYFDDDIKAAQDKYDKIKSSLDSYESSFTDKTTESKDKPSTPSEVMEETTSTKTKTKADMYSEAIRKAAAEDKTVRDVLDMFDTPYDSSIADIEEETSIADIPNETSTTDIEEEDLEKYQQEYERAEEELNRTNEWADQMKSALAKTTKSADTVLKGMESKSISDKLANFATNPKDKVIDTLEPLANTFGYDGVDYRSRLEEAYKENGTKGLRTALEELSEVGQAYIDGTVKDAQERYNHAKSRVDSFKASTADKTKTSFTDKPTEAEAEAKPGTNIANDKTSPSDYLTKSDKAKTKTKADMYSEAIRKAAAEDKTVRDVLDMFDTPYDSSIADEMKPTEAKPDTNMANAKTSPSDYLTKANKDSTKELPKEAPSRNDFGNHAVDTLKGVTDRIADSVTADALGLKSFEEFAKENGYNPEKLSTMKAYQSYQNKEIMKAIPGIVKQIGSYIVERVKDAIDPSQLGERVRNTLARYNMATLIGAAILSIKSGAGLQASIDQALTMVDTEDQPAVSDYLEDVLSDEGAVNDLSNAFDDALAPQQNSDTAELDESIINIGRKDNTDYDDFNAGLGTSGTTSDADAKVFIARNVKADPILRKMISKIGK